MLPFLPNQIQTQESNPSTLQQVMLPDPRFVNSSNLRGNQINQFPCSSCAYHNPLHALDHRFPVPTMSNCNNLNNHMGILHNNLGAMPGFPNMANFHVVAQNSQLGMPNGQFSSQNFNQIAQFQSQGHFNINPQNSNQVVPRPQNMNQNVQLPPHGQFCNSRPRSSNQVPPRPQSFNQNARLSHPGKFLNRPQKSKQSAPRTPNFNQMVPSQPHGCLNMQNSNYNVLGPPHGQFCSHNAPQNLNQMMGLPHGAFCLQNPMQNFSQNIPTHMGFLSTPCSHLSLGCPNQMHGMCSQNHAFIMNSQMGPGNPNVNSNSAMSSDEAMKFNNQDTNLSVPPTMDPNAMQKSSLSGQHVQGNSLPSLAHGPMQMHRTQKNLQPGGFQPSQENHVEDGASNISNINNGNFTSKKFARNHRSGKKESTHMSVQKSQFQHPANTGNFTPHARNGGKGQYGGSNRKSHLAKSNKKAVSECPRSSLPLNYTEKEIQQWREARKKNFPTKTTVEKKLAERHSNSELIDRDIKTRCQELKEILAKQAELGVQVAEIPANYLFEPEDQVCKVEGDRMLQNNHLSELENQVCKVEGDRMVQNQTGKFRNKYNKRRKHGRNNRHLKKQKFEDKASTEPMSNTKKPPSLLEKLLSADIKGDKSRLLQVFRFMVTNSFFKDWPEKHLQFPSITVKEERCSNETVKEQHSSCPQEDNVSGVVEKVGVEEFKGRRDHSVVDEEEDDEDDDDNEDGEEMVNGHASKEDCIREKFEKSDGEEGEITE